MTFGPTDPWPDHPKPWWRDTLAFARSNGWSLELTSGHGWGRLTCSGGCKILVFSTGRAGENAARRARRDIERCAHATRSPIAQITWHLEQAERLLDAAQNLIQDRANHAAVEELIAEADAQLTASEEEGLLARIAALPDTPKAPDGDLDEAESHLLAARVRLADVGPPNAKPLRQRARAIRERITSLRAQLATLPTNLWTLPPRPSDRREDRHPVLTQFWLSTDN